MAHRARTGIVILQLGTPDAPTEAAVRVYLREFLSDRRVIDLPRALWLPLLYLRVLRTRPAASARLYAKVWTAGGSPLMTLTVRQAAAVAARLEADFPGATRVAIGMRYGNPSIAAAVDELTAAGCERIVAVPMYPQYAGASTGSSLERLFEIVGARRVVPSIRVLPPYFDDPAYIGSLAAVARRTLAGTSPDHFLISFHGLPARYVAEGDPYAAQCRATADALITEMGWPADRVTISFQSRLGREEWLRPYTDQVLPLLAEQKLRSLAVICPGFTADCLETIEEMGMTNREMYQAKGGGEYHLIPCVNDDPVWLDGLYGMVRRELRGWLDE